MLCLSLLDFFAVSKIDRQQGIREFPEAKSSILIGIVSPEEMLHISGIRLDSHVVKGEQEILHRNLALECSAELIKGSG